MTTRPVHPFTPTSRDVWRIALPASFAFITEPLVGFVDLTVIGRLGDPDRLGGLVLGTLAFDLLFSLVYFLRISTAGLTAQAVGARDPDDGLLHLVRAALLGFGLGVLLIALIWPLQLLLGTILSPPEAVRPAFNIYFAVRLCAAPFTLFNYALLGWFYGRAAATTGMLQQMLVNGLNMAGSLLFVFGLQWGVAGVAAAAIVAHGLAALFGLNVVLRHFGGWRRLRSLIRWREVRNVPALVRLFALSRDITIRSIALMSAFAFFTSQTSRMGEVSLAANAVLMQFLMIGAFFLDGQGQAGEQLCGKAVGANYRPAFERAMRLTLSWGLAISAILFTATLLGGSTLIGLMTTSAPVQAEATGFIIFAAIAAFTGMPAFVLDGILSGATMNTLIRNGMVAAFAIYLAVALALQPLLGVTGLWISINSFFLARAGIFYWGVRRRLPTLFS